jgi:RNA polymerase sigma factor (sigma-70 family)
MVLGVCRRVLRHTADAEDACQATFLVLLRRAAQVRDPDRLGSWLFGVAWRTANKLRLSRRNGVSLPDDLPDLHSRDDWPMELDAAIAKLPEKYRTPVVLCHLQGLSPSEVANQLGCAPATIATRLHRARMALRRRLMAAGYSVPAALIAGSAIQVPHALASALNEMAAGRTISPTAARLADGALRSLFMTRIRWTTAAAALCLAGVGVLGFRAAGQEPRDPLRPTPVFDSAQPPPPPVGPVVEPAQFATVTTTNFRVTAPSTRIALLIADAAERTRKEIAVAWLGKELPAWPQPCPVRVSIGRGGAGGARVVNLDDGGQVLLGRGSGGATTFNFDGGAMKSEMVVEGELDQLLVDVVPHEVTHCVMADHFRGPLPRWADEGMALLTETEEEQSRYRLLAQRGVNTGDLVSVRALLEAKEYPGRNIGTFFAQSFWTTKVLVDRKDRPTFVQFVKDGKKDGWESASKKHYGYATLGELEADVLSKLGKEPTPDPAKTSETPPTLMLASADAEGRISISMPKFTIRPVTQYLQREIVESKDGQPVKRTYYEPVTSYQSIPGTLHRRTFAKSEVKAFHLDGRAVEEKALVDALKDGPKAVVLSTRADGIDKALASILKPDTLILVVPTSKLDPAPVEPGTDKIGR